MSAEITRHGADIYIAASFYVPPASQSQLPSRDEALVSGPTRYCTTTTAAAAAATAG